MNDNKDVTKAIEELSENISAIIALKERIYSAFEQFAQRINSNMQKLSVEQVTGKLDFNAPNASDCISRQEAIRLVHSVLYEMMVESASKDIDEPMKPEDRLLLKVNKAVCATLMEMPSAQPESTRGWYQKEYRDGKKEAESIIRCKDCIYENMGECKHNFGLLVANEENFCSYAERREDESEKM